MKTKTFFILSVLITVFLICCSCSVQNKSDIESIHVLFYNYSFEPILPINCDDMKRSIPSMKASSVIDEKGDSTGILIDNHGILDTTIVNPSVLKEIVRELKKLNPDSISYPIDARISCFIKYKNGTEEQICIGGYLADCINYHGINQKKNNRLLYLIKNSIGYYSWMGDRILEYSDELQDKSFKRDFVIGYSGRKF